MKKYVSPKAMLESIATADIITVSLGEGIGEAVNVSLSKYFEANAMDIGDFF